MVTIRVATGEEQLRVADLLPFWKFEMGDFVLTAEAGAPSRAVGLGVLGTRRAHSGVDIAHADYAIFPRFQESDWPGRLAEALLVEATRRNLDEVRLTSPRLAGSAECLALATLGFLPHRTLITYEFDARAFAARARSAYEKLKARGMLPSKAHIVPLSAANWPDVVQLLQTENLTNAFDVAAALRAGLGAFYSPSSRVLIHEEKVRGVMLTRIFGRQINVLALVTSSNLRGGNGWANALLSHSSGEIAIALGGETVVITSDPRQNPATTSAARRTGASETRRALMLSTSVKRLA